MVDLGCQDTEWVSGSDKNILDAILWWDGLILEDFSMDKGKFDYLGCISSWFGAPRGALGSKLVDLGCHITRFEVLGIYS